MNNAPLTSHEKITLAALYERLRTTALKLERSYDQEQWLLDAAAAGLTYHRTNMKAAERENNFTELRFHMKMALYSLPDE